MQDDAVIICESMVEEGLSKIGAAAGGGAGAVSGAVLLASVRRKLKQKIKDVETRGGDASDLKWKLKQLTSVKSLAKYIVGGAAAGAAAGATGPELAQRALKAAISKWGQQAANMALKMVLSA